MYDAKSIIQSAFSSSLSDLASQYEILASLKPEERANYVSVANEYSQETETLISSEKTKSAIKLLIYFQFLSRFKYKIHGGDNWRGANGRAMQHMVDGFSHVCSMAKASDEILNTFKGFAYETPNFEKFLEISLQGLHDAYFFTQVEFVTNELYGVKFPVNEAQDINGWVSSARLSEQNWDWEYKNRIAEWNRRWFKSKSTMIEIKKEWVDRKENLLLYLNEIEPIFSSLYVSNKLLKSLKIRQLQSSLGLEAVNKSYAAINDGVKLKHLLLEEGHELQKAWNEIGGGL